jgi:hypothetical protein
VTSVTPATVLITDDVAPTALLKRALGPADGEAGRTSAAPQEERR